MGWAQWIIATLLVVQVVSGLALHGRPREPHDFSNAILGAALMALLLHAGGFWQ